MKKKGITVIVPVYNVERYIDRCLESLVSQTYTNLEIILIDDQSPDACPQKCDEWVKTDERIIVIHKKHGGASAARNCGLKHAKGEFVAFIDPDDYIELDYFEKLLNALEDNKVDISLCRYFGEEHMFNKEYIFAMENYSWIDENMHCMVWGALFKKELLNGIYFKEDIFIAEDTLFFAMAVKQARYLIQINRELYHYEMREGSALCSKFSKKMMTELDSWKIICETFVGMPKIEYTARIGYAQRCIAVVGKYLIEKEFYNYYAEVVSQYRLNAKKLILFDIKQKKIKAIFRDTFLFLLPKIYVLVHKIYKGYKVK